MKAAFADSGRNKIVVVAGDVEKGYLRDEIGHRKGRI
jgi:hypothetical protein